MQTAVITALVHAMRVNNNQYNYADLETMTERLEAGYYSCLRLFIADMRRVFANCKMYNERSTDYFRCAISLEKFFVTKMKDSGLWLEFSQLNASAFYEHTFNVIYYYYYSDSL